MATLQEAKIFGGIGTILMLIGGVIPYVGPAVNILGLVLVLIAVKTISDITKDTQIFNDFLLYFIINILTIAVMIGVTFLVFDAIEGFSFFQNLNNGQITNFPSFWNSVGSLVYACVIGLFIGWILTIIGALYFKRSYHRIAKHTDIELFKTAGTVYFVGALTLIILVGFLIIFIAKIIEIIAYFSLPDSTSKSPSNQQPRRCPVCGRSIPEDSNLCPYCGK
jgi:uncharacterized membrane protein